MANASGYKVIKGAVPADLAQVAAEEVSKGSLKIKTQRIKYTEFEVPLIC